MTEEAYDGYGQLKYMIQLQKIANGRMKRIDIHIEDLEEAFRK